VIYNNFGPISDHFRDTATYSWKLSTENCG